MTTTKLQTHFSRRRAFGLFAAAAGTKLLSSLTTVKADDTTCVVSPAETEGPYFVDEMLNRSDIRVDPATGAVSSGLQLDLSVTVHNVTDTACGLLSGAQVDVWHCDATGIYSDQSANNSIGKKFLRGYQITGQDGNVKFTTVYPGWYEGRTVHIHVKVRTFSGTSVAYEFTSQIYFDEAVTDEVYTQAPYSSRPSRTTRNATDGIYSGASEDGSVTRNNGEMMLLHLTRTETGYAGTLDVGIKMSSGTPTIAEDGIVDTAGKQPGISPGSWFTVKGTGLALISRSLNAARDVVDNMLPTTLNGVSVMVNDQPAYLASVSPTEIVAQAPGNLPEGPANVTVTTVEGTSEPVTTNVYSLLPGFFSSQNLIYAVRADGASIASVNVTLPGTSTTQSGAAPGMGAPGTGGPGGPGRGPGGTTTATAAKSGDSLTLYGSGFGATSPEVPPGAYFQGSASLTDAVQISIGGVPAVLTSSALTSAGIYQFKVAVPVLEDGDHDVVATVSWATSPRGARLRVRA